MEYVNEEEISCLIETKSSAKTHRTVWQCSPPHRAIIFIFNYALPGSIMFLLLCLSNRPNQIPVLLLMLFTLVSAGKIDLTQGHCGDVIFFLLTFSILNHILLII